jgi:hypothetical protein
MYAERPERDHNTANSQEIYFGIDDFLKVSVRLVLTSFEMTITFQHNKKQQNTTNDISPHNPINMKPVNSEMMHITLENRTTNHNKSQQLGKLLPCS